MPETSRGVIVEIPGWRHLEEELAALRVEVAELRSRLQDLETFRHAHLDPKGTIRFHPV